MYINRYIGRQGHSYGGSDTDATPCFWGITPILNYLIFRKEHNEHESKVSQKIANGIGDPAAHWRDHRHDVRRLGSARASRSQENADPNTNCFGYAFANTNPHTYVHFSTLYHSDPRSHDHRRRNLENRLQPECRHRHVRESSQRGGSGLRE